MDQPPKTIRQNKYQGAVGGTPALRDDVSRLCTFRFGSESRDALNKLLGEGTSDERYLDGSGFYQMIVSQLTETHAEGYGLSNVFADTFVALATGAKPIRISISGHLYTTPEEDHKIDFVDLYHNFLRGTQLKKLGLTLDLSYQDTAMHLWLQDLALSHTSTMQDMTAVSLTGVGYSYRVQRLIQEGS